MHRLSPLAIVTGLVFAGCSAGPAIGSNTHPEDQSAGGHRAEAAQHDQESRHESERANSGVAAIDPAGATRLNDDDDAAAQQREAQEHRLDAAALENNMNSACAQVPAAERPQCTIGSRRAAGVEDVPGGVRIRFAAGGDPAAATASRARCTHAYADFTGRETMPACVLAVRDLTIDARDESGAVVLTLTTADAASVAELRRRAREGGAAGATAAGGGPASAPGAAGGATRRRGGRH